MPTIGEGRKGIIRDGPNKNILTPQEAQDKITVLDENKAVLGEKTCRWLTQLIQNDASDTNSYSGRTLVEISMRTPEEIRKIIAVASDLLGNDAHATLSNLHIWDYTPGAVRDVIQAVLNGMGGETGRDFLTTKDGFDKFYIRENGTYRCLTPDEIRQRIELCKTELGMEEAQKYFKTQTNSNPGIYTEDAQRGLKIMEDNLGRKLAVDLFSKGWLGMWRSEYTEDVFIVANKLIGSTKIAKYLEEHPHVMYSISNLVDSTDYAIVAQNFDYLASKFGKETIWNLILGSGNSRLVDHMLTSLKCDQDKVRRVTDRMAKEIPDVGDAAERERFARLTLDMILLD